MPRIPATQLFTSPWLAQPSLVAWWTLLHGRVWSQHMPSTAAWQRLTPWRHPVQGSDMATVQAWADGGLVTGASLFTAIFRQPQDPLSGLEFSGPGYKAALFVPR